MRILKNDYMLFECLECGETYLADNRCDGYNCPKCNGHIVPRGFIKEIEEGIKDVQDKVNKAKHNGLIRKYKRKDDDIKVTRTLYADGEAHTKEILHGIDLSSGKDITVRVNFNAEEFLKDLAEKLLKTIEEQRIQ